MVLISMKKFYSYTNGKQVRYYTNLKDLCQAEGLSYDNVYYRVQRKKEDSFESENIRVEKLFFEQINT